MGQKKKERETGGGDITLNPVINRITAPSYFFKEILTVKEAGEYMGLSVSSIHRYAYDGKIPSYRPIDGGKGHVYFRKSELDAFMLRNRKSADYELEEKADAIVNGEGGERNKHVPG